MLQLCVVRVLILLFLIVSLLSSECSLQLLTTLRLLNLLFVCDEDRAGLKLFGLCHAFHFDLFDADGAELNKAFSLNGSYSVLILVTCCPLLCHVHKRGIC